ncbi:hypothetical protein HJG60_010279 [Phyllostomus discolor]|uniref:Uncharacterized protein n=1 Tax=Phyllostomus discolor TaxID=89673 RepID=A0A834B1I5_9CHIR|nr:hypothetical protein HJG60_010279 [Phyllostomus discolor]
MPFPVLIPRWVGLCMFQDPVALSYELSCETSSFSHCHSLLPTPQAFTARVFEALLSCAGTLGCILSHSPVAPPGLSINKCGKSHPPATVLPCLTSWVFNSKVFQCFYVETSKGRGVYWVKLVFFH